MLFCAKWVRERSFGVLSCKMGRGALFLTCYDVFGVIGWFPCENIEESAFTYERLKPGSFEARSRKMARQVLFFTCYDVFDIVGL